MSTPRSDLSALWLIGLGLLGVSWAIKTLATILQAWR